MTAYEIARNRRKEAQAWPGSRALLCLACPTMSPSGDRRELVFFEADDYRPYRRLAAAAPRRAGISVWAYCLMPNHVHLACAGGREWVEVIFAEARRHYTAAVSIGSDGRTICSRAASARW